MHRQKYGWDTELLQADQETWRSIKVNISGFEKELPRKVSVVTTASHAVSVFVDSSKRVYAYFIYVTSISENAQSESGLFTTACLSGRKHDKVQVVSVNDNIFSERWQFLVLYMLCGVLAISYTAHFRDENLLERCF
ncbi:hypothetical protein Y032_0092g2529 [Ancylostoma ceylanicum]|uniref:Uncharacterized protein n=1 Tax=Ancylostoma ceylanicum TaxID=53326 RepID=A0A016TLV6_9BILA|nr:hypothetical protein Y032_0092g2529 [Ancylostoma ceylanicum]